jgi:hypothetical protein
MPAEEVKSNSETLFEHIKSNSGGQSEGRAIVNYINNHMAEFTQPRIQELVEYAQGKGVSFEGLTIPSAPVKKGLFGIFSGGRRRTRKMRKSRRSGKGKSRRSRR